MPGGNFVGVSDGLSPRDRVYKWATPEMNTGCWLWTGVVRKDGYGQINMPLNGMKKRTRMAHLFAYEAFVGEVPDRLELDHLCRMRCCVNPDHLEPVTRKENVRRVVSPCAQQMAKTHCPKGHPYSGDNLYQTSYSRYCRACTVEKRAAYKERRLAKAVDAGRS